MREKAREMEGGREGERMADGRRPSQLIAWGGDDIYTHSDE